ncbi:hypothetical protein CRYUN_Cryun36dG0060500 [Craigia yunnanensis]
MAQSNILNGWWPPLLKEIVGSPSRWLVAALVEDHAQRVESNSENCISIKLVVELIETAANATVAAAQAAAAVIQLTAAANEKASAAEEAAAIKIQLVFLSYLALVTAKARARAQRIRMVVEDSMPTSQRQSPHGRSTPDHQIRHAYQEIDRGMEENIKILDMDLCDSKGILKCRNSYSHHPQAEREVEHRFSTHCSSNCAYSKQENYEVSPAPSALTDLSPEPAVILRTILSAQPKASPKTIQLSPTLIHQNFLLHFQDLNMQNPCHMTTPYSPLTWLRQNLQEQKSDHKVHRSQGQIHLKGNQAGEGHRWKAEIMSQGQ